MDVDKDPQLSSSDVHMPPAFHRNVSILKELPVDNIYQILSFSDPKDIFAFSQTCKAFYQITLTRTVWLNALRRVCEINSLFKPSFPYDDMSFSDLQRAATFGAAPRFTRRLYKREGDGVSVPLMPFHRRVFTPRVTKFSTVASEDPGTLKTLYLVPGGRFLVITTDTLLHLWDLGYDATKLIRPHALASVALPDPGGDPSVSVLPTDDGTGLEIMVMSSKLGVSTISNYHIFPVTAHPEFIPVSESPVVLQFAVARAFLIKPGHCVLRRGWHIILWNTAQNLWATWKSDEYPEKVFGYQGQIMSVGAKNITIWEIPVPHTDDIGNSLLENHHPMISLAHTFLPGMELEIPVSSDWFCATSIKPCFLSLVGWKAQKRYIARYTMQSLARNANPNLPASLPILMDTCLIPAASDYLEFATDIQPCGTDALTTWLSQDSPVIELHVSPMPLERQVEGPPFKTVRLFEYTTTEERPEDFPFSLCPVTGRLCAKTGVTENEIIVLDYLIPEWVDGQ